jgi:hypothetical protein
MLFKPQFASVMILLFILAGRYRILPTVAAIGCVLYVLSSAVSGWAWPFWWWRKALEFHSVDQVINAGNSVGWLGFAQALFGASSTPAWFLGWVLTLATGAGLSLIWWKKLLTLERRMALTAVALVLIQPHAMYYEAGIAVLTLAVIADQQGRRAILPLGFVWALSFSAFAGYWLGFNPLFLVLLACGAFAIQVLREPLRNR